MHRVTVAIEPALLDELDAYMARSGATNRSEALRDLVRRGLAGQGQRDAAADCVGVLSYTVEPAVRALGRRVPQSRQDRHDLTVAALSVPLDHDSAVEVAVMRGDVGAVTAFADSLFLERGIRHGALSLVPVQTQVEHHTHGDGRAHSHTHLKVKESF
ncbi:CopG family transcriptional regulator, nickel-responsive regulator [Ketogulonicigenium robustum]|uniref:CopG family transcriptional regulator, nickel-responsive regulator n=1 Tax=Ketogulonicigenium robustum TaxID=92947 RepID=A0A1W6P1U6_9RHOB|nr:nickel-responsive transcriptional regulator NikR [Ketogulonicigenium robustum]ARO15456.1 CopG family transcriptional regulator, nickel-responsive regulator [Ketogulonicigenium robustum]